jgi:hypothetical protein
VGQPGPLLRQTGNHNEVHRIFMTKEVFLNFCVRGNFSSFDQHTRSFCRVVHPELTPNQEDGHVSSRPQRMPRARFSMPAASVALALLSGKKR